MKIIDRIVQWAGLFAGICLFFMMIIGAIDVVGSKLFNTPLPGVFELTESLMVGAVFMAIAFARSKRLHIAVDLLTSHLKPSVRIRFDLIICVLTFFFFFLIAWQGWEFGIKSLRIREYESGIIPYPVYPSKLALALGATIMSLQCLKDLIEASIRMLKRNPRTSGDH
jgi:TRAP-type C4-dicarboxylate transport system permease small subunit